MTHAQVAALLAALVLAYAAGRVSAAGSRMLGYRAGWHEGYRAGDDYGYRRALKDQRRRRTHTPEGDRWTQWNQQPAKYVTTSRTAASRTPGQRVARQ